jgi:hypothetical protein
MIATPRLSAFPSTTFSLRPEGKMLDDLRRNYRAMSGMIFGEAPIFEESIEGVIELETALNVRAEGAEESDGQEHG